MDHRALVGRVARQVQQEQEQQGHQGLADPAVRQVQVLPVLQVRLGQLEWELQVLLVQVARLDLMVQVDPVDRQV